VISSANCYFVETEEEASRLIVIEAPFRQQLVKKVDALNTLFADECRLWNGRSWRKAAVHKQAASHFPALNLPRARAECSATKLDFTAGDSERALQARFRVETP
jgi:hypothetical protein